MTKYALLYPLFILGCMTACQETSSSNTPSDTEEAATTSARLSEEKGCVSGNCENGKGVWRYYDMTYQGRFKDGEWHGRGLLRYNNGDFYSGSFEGGYRSGRGHYKSISEGWEYNGEWSYDQMEGQGTYRTHKGDRYKGSFVNNSYEGYGVMQYRANLDGTPSETPVTYYGEWSEDDYIGYGVMFYRDSSYKSGIWGEYDLETPMPIEDVVAHLNQQYDLELDFK